MSKMSKEQFETELNKLIERMDDRQLGQFLTVTTTRHIVSLDEHFFNSANKRDVGLLNLLFVYIGLNSIYLFNYSKLADYDLARALTLALAHARLRDRDRVLDRVLALALDLALDRVLDRTHFLAPDLDRVLAIALNLDPKNISINDAKAVLNNSFVYNNGQSEEISNYSSRFLNILHNLKGEYWVKFFKNLFKNNFQLEKSDIDAILSLKENQLLVQISETSAYLSATASKRVDSNEIRLMVLGDKGEGKTSFTRRFKKLDANMPEKNESTPGVDIHEELWKNISEDVQSSEIEGHERDDKDIKIKIWDFAGHHATHAAHKFFLSEKCVYVIVCQTRSSEHSIESKIEKWLEHIRDYAGFAKTDTGDKFKIFVLINKQDQHKVYVNEAAINENYKEYDLAFHYLNIDTDNKPGGKLYDFKRELLAHMQTIDTKVAAGFKLMQERINAAFEKEGEKHNYVDKSVIQEIINDIKKDDESIKNSSTEDILRTLHKLAFCFWFDKIDRQEINTVVLNPRWITTVVYKIINWVQNSKPYNNATIKITDFDDALRKDKDKLREQENNKVFPKDKDHYVFAIMVHFELAYSEDKETLVVPYCLKDSYPDNETGLAFEFNNSVQLRFEIVAKDDNPRPKFPESVIPKFIVKKYDSVYKNKNEITVTSKNGAMFKSKDGKSIAEIKQNRDDNYIIYITAQSRNDRIDREENIGYLVELSGCLTRILSEHKRFKVMPEISYRAEKTSGKPVYIPIDEENPNLANLREGEPEKYTKCRDCVDKFGIAMDKFEKHLEQLNNEIEKVTCEVNNMAELGAKQKEKFEILMEDLSKACKNDNDVAKENCRKKFNADFGMFKEVLSVVANFAKLADFFGFDASFLASLLLK